jgi:hypothetical protein
MGFQHQPHPAPFSKYHILSLQFSSNLLHHNFVLSGFGAKTTCKQMLDTTLAITIIESPSFPSILIERDLFA